MTKRPVKKTSGITNLLRQRKALTIISLIVLIFGLIVAVVKLQAYLEEQKNLDDLKAASKELRSVYDKLLEANKGNVDSTYFRNQCSYAYVGPYSKSISCGPDFDISLNTPGTDGETPEIKISHAVSASRFGSVSSYVRDGGVVLANLPAVQGVLSCHVTYAPSKNNVPAGYHLSCRKTVPDFLPGYEVK